MPVVVASVAAQSNRKPNHHELQAAEEQRIQKRQSILQLKLAEDSFIADRPQAADHSGWKKSFVELGDYIYNNVTTKAEFEAFFQMLIAIMCVLMGIETYLTEDGHPVLDALMMTLVVFFTLEVVLKFLAESIKPWRFFHSAWNTLDLIIVVLCMPFVKNNTIGRLMRMIRLGKVTAQVPAFKVFVFGIINAGKDILNISALVVLMLYMYAIAGVTLFGGNDPLRFGSFHSSFVTLFSISTMDNWAYIMHFNMYGCSTFEEECTGSQALPLVSVIFFVSYVVITGLIMLSMFIGVISIAMGNVIAELKEEQGKKKEAERSLKKEKALKEAEGTGLKRNQSMKTINGRAKVMALVKSVLEGIDVEPELVRYDTFVGRKVHKAAKVADAIVKSTAFKYLIYFLVAGGGFLVGIKIYFVKELTPVTDWFGFIMTTVFTIEMLLKVMACEFEPWHYFYAHEKVQSWNCLDCSVVVGSFVPGIPGDLMMVFRMLLVLKIMQNQPGLRVSVESFLAAMGEVGTIGALMTIVVFFFAIVGNTFFAKNDPGHFGDLHTAMLTLFRVATLSSWTDIVYVNMYGCMANQDPALPGYRQPCSEETSEAKGAIAAVFFILFVVIGTFVMLNLFIGVIIIAMEATMSKIAEENSVLRRAKELAKDNNISSAEMTQFYEMFHMLDADGSGDLDLAELQIAVKQSRANIRMQDVQHMLDAIDEDGTGEIDFAEFLQFIINAKATVGKPLFTEKDAAESQHAMRERQYQRLLRFVHDKGHQDEYERYVNAEHGVLEADVIVSFGQKMTPASAALRMQKLFKRKRMRRILSTHHLLLESIVEERAGGSLLSVRDGGDKAKKEGGGSFSLDRLVDSASVDSTPRPLREITDWKIDKEQKASDGGGAEYDVSDKMEGDFQGKKFFV
jgi:voltage-gated sodium channel